MATIDADRYLARIGYTAEPKVDLETLGALQVTHMTAVPFENLDVFHGLSVPTDADSSVAKIVDHGRGGWCFENNGAFSELLVALGFDVIRLGAAVLLSGPTTVIDHLTLEVTIDEPYLVDVGFGDSFIKPLRLNASGAQDGGTGTFEFMPSSQGLTLTEHVDGLPKPLYRFKRMNREMPDFDGASQHLQTDPNLKWSQKPFATRLLDGGPDRVTLLHDRLKFDRGGTLTEVAVKPDKWEEALGEWFAMKLPS